MSTDLNFSISTEGLADRGKQISNEAKIIQDAIDEINEARKSLDGWVSKNKDRYDDKLMKTLPKLEEMVDVIKSYGGIATKTSERAVAVENKIAAAIDDEIPA